MTGSNDLKPVLVIGIGNPLLSDDGVGLHLLEQAQADSASASEQVEFLDGGTQGIALLGRIENRQALLFLDAVSTGAAPGTIHELAGDEVLQFRSDRTTAHESSATEILKTALLTNDLPPQVHIIGIEPAELRTFIGLSEVVLASVDKARTIIAVRIESLVASLE